MSEPATEPRGEYRSLPVDKVTFGRGALERLPAEVERLGARRALVVTTRSLAGEGKLLARVQELLGPCHAGTFAAMRQHTPSGDVWAAAAEARRVEADLLVSFGGSSAIDGAKDVAYVLAAKIPDVAELNRLAATHRGTSLDGTVLPHIAISTTLSAGEFQPAAAVTDEATRTKGGLGHAQMTPRVVLLDPSVTVATPAWLWLSTGMKALDHAVERTYSPHHQPLVDVACLEAIRLLMRHLPASRATTEEGLVARGYCQIAAWFSIFGGPNVRTGLSHVLGHQIGARFDVPHGYTSCITMPHVVRLVHRRAPDRLALIARAMGLDVPEAQAGEAVAQTIAQFVAGLGLPARLRDVGVPREGLDGVMAAANHELGTSERVRQGATPEDLAELVRAAW